MSLAIKSRIVSVVTLAVVLALSASIGVSQATQPAQREIRGVVRAGTQPELVKDGFHGVEGPVSTPDGGLYFSAIDENRTYKLDRSGETPTSSSSAVVTPSMVL